MGKFMVSYKLRKYRVSGGTKIDITGQASSRRQVFGSFPVNVPLLSGRANVPINERRLREALANARKSVKDIASNLENQSEELSDSWYAFEVENVTFNSVYKNKSKGMRKRDPLKFLNEPYWSVVDEGNCVPETLRKIYPKVFDDIEDGPYTHEMLQEVCRDRDITCMGWNVDEPYNWIPTARYISKHYNHSPFYYAERDNHLYVLDKTLGKSMANHRKNSKPKNKEEPEAKEFSELEEGLTPDYEEKKYTIVQNESELMRLLCEFLEKGEIPKIKPIALTKDTFRLGSFTAGNTTVDYIPNHKELIEVAEACGRTDVGFMKNIHEEFWKGSLPTSSLNDITYDELKSEPNRHYVHLYGRDEWSQIPGVEQTIDMNKCYTHCLRDSTESWVRFDPLSIPTEYTGGISDNCFYYVETENTLPCHGNGWYTAETVHWLCHNGVQHKITHEIRGQTEKSDIFKQYCDDVIEKTPNGFKHIINDFIGKMGSKEKRYANVCAVSRDQDEIVRLCFEKGFTFVEMKGLFFAIKIQVSIKYQNNMPMAHQIYCRSALKLADAINRLKSLGHTIRSYNTDSITFKADKLYTPVELGLSDSAIGGWKVELTKPVPLTAIVPVGRDRRFKMRSVPWRLFKEGEDNLNDVLNRGESIFVEGEAGFGKTYAVKEWLQGKDAEISAFTNVASSNIGGTTLHKLFKLKIGEDMVPKMEWTSDKKIWVIEEVSQLPTEIFIAVASAMKQDVQVIALGDMEQILPVGETRSCEPALKMLFKQKFVMTQYKRGDANLLEACRVVRRREAIPFEEGIHGEMAFCFTREKRAEINNQCIQEHLQKLKHKGCKKVQPIKNQLGEEQEPFYIYKGMPLRCDKTTDETLNGQRWRVKKIEGDYATLTYEDKELLVDLVEDFIFSPGYAMTIHSSQGLTISEPYTLYIESAGGFSEDDRWRMIYTAVSRAVKKEQIKVNYC